jgi:predicted nuclease of predicted toxin-antitoxin system
MRVLLDECVDPRVRHLLVPHEVRTVHEMGWGSLEDGPLLNSADGVFEVLLTIDRGIEFQSNLRTRSFGVLIVHVPKNQVAYYRAILAEILAGLEESKPGYARHVQELGSREK